MAFPELIPNVRNHMLKTTKQCSQSDAAGPCKSTKKIRGNVTDDGTFLEDRDGEGSCAAAQLDLRLLRVVVEALGGLQPVDVVLEPVAVGRLVGGAVLDLGGLDGDLGGEAGAQLVGHDEDHVGVRDELHAEGALALALVAVLEVALHRDGLAGLLVLPRVELLVVELVEDDLLVARHRLRLVDVGHLEERDGAAVLDGELVDERVVGAVRVVRGHRRGRRRPLPLRGLLLVGVLVVGEVAVVVVEDVVLALRLLKRGDFSRGSANGHFLGRNT